MKREVVTLFLVLGALLLTTSCLFSRKKAEPPPPKPIEPWPVLKTERTYPIDFSTLWLAARQALEEEKGTYLYTIDTQGLFEVYERSEGFLFAQERLIVTLTLKAIDEGHTRIAAETRAEEYQVGGLDKKAGWYPSRDVDDFFAQFLLKLIEEKLLEVKKDVDGGSEGTAPHHTAP